MVVNSNISTLEIIGRSELLQLYLVDMILRRVGLLVRHVAGPHQRQDHREEHQAVEQTEHHHEEEHLEEHHEGIVVRGRQQDDRQERGETAVENCWADL